MPCCNERTVRLEVPYEPPNLSCSHLGMNQIQDHHENGCNESDNHSCNSHIRLEIIDKRYNFSIDYLEPCQLLIQHHRVVSLTVGCGLVVGEDRILFDQLVLQV